MQIQQSRGDCQSQVKNPDDLRSVHEKVVFSNWHRIGQVRRATGPPKLGGGQVGSGLVENAVNCTCQCSQRRDCCQGEQDQQERVLRQVLTFLFFPQTYQ